MSSVWSPPYGKNEFVKIFMTKFETRRKFLCAGEEASRIPNSRRVEWRELFHLRKSHSFQSAISAQFYPSSILGIGFLVVFYLILMFQTNLLGNVFFYYNNNNT